MSGEGVLGNWEKVFPTSSQGFSHSFFKGKALGTSLRFSSLEILEEPDVRKDQLKDWGLKPLKLNDG